MENDGKVIALLIDAENVSPKYIKTIIDEVSMYGTPAYKLHLRRLDGPRHGELEKNASGAQPDAHPAVQLSHRAKTRRTPP